MPARLTGEQLRWRDGVGEDVLQLGSGVDAPARFELGDGYFVGPMIQVWPAENLIEINHAGEFRMPTAVLPSGLSGPVESSGNGGAAGQGSSSPNITWTKAPHCRWNESMRFDGRTAVLSGGVTIEAELVHGREPWDLTLSGDQLHVTLSDEVRIEDVQTIRDASVQQIALIQSDERPVMVQADRRAADGVMEARHLLFARQLTLMPVSGKLNGQGAGWYRTWMRPQSKGPLSSGSTKSRDAQRQLMGLHLTYHDLFEGDLSTRNLTFHHGVRVGVRNVQSWDQTFDVAQMDSLLMGDSTLDCDQLRVGVAQPYTDSSTRITGWRSLGNSKPMAASCSAHAAKRVYSKARQLGRCTRR